MSIIKPLQGATGPANIHTITSVEIFQVGPQLRWVGKYRSVAQEGGDPTAFGTVADVPYVPSENPITAFEQACLAAEGSIFYGGDLLGNSESLLGLERQLAWGRVKQNRDAHLNSGVTISVGRFDSDLNTLVNALGAVATMAPTDTKGWIMADHTPVLLTWAQIQELGAALANLRDSTYAHGSSLYAQIQSAQTVESVRSIVWTPPPN